MIAPNLTHWKKFRKLCCPRWKKHSKNFSVYVILNVLQYLSQILNCDLSENVSMLWSAKQVTFDQTRKPLRFHQRAWNYEVNVCQFCHDSGYQSALYLTFFPLQSFTDNKHHNCLVILQHQAEEFGVEPQELANMSQAELTLRTSSDQSLLSTRHKRKGASRGKVVDSMNFIS